MAALKRFAVPLIFVILGGIACGATIATRDAWWPQVRDIGGPTGEPAAAAPADDHSHAGHDHDDHAGHSHDGHEHAESEANSVALSEQARANLGLEMRAVEPSNYVRNLVIPGVVVEQPGHSERRITTSLTGIVTKVHVYPGQLVKPGDPLVDLQGTGELLTVAQSELLKTIQEIALVDVELKRLTPLVENGSLPARNKLEKEYERTRLEAQKLVQIQELLVRGLTANQITELVEHKELLREFTLHAPGGPANVTSKTPLHDHPSAVPPELVQQPAAVVPADLVFTIEQIEVFPGKLVQPGGELCDLALHTELYLEGHAFERDSALLGRVMQEQQPITAVFESGGVNAEVREGLRIRYIENRLNPTTRTLQFFVPIKNEVLRDDVADNGVVYRSWRFKPGQKVRLLVPEQSLADQIVLPADAVVMDGPDAYVFRSNGELMERVPVILEARDPRFVVIRNDGSVFPGDELAMNQAYQINLALKKQQGSGVDLHAGHNH